MQLLQFTTFWSENESVISRIRYTLLVPVDFTIFIDTLTVNTHANGSHVRLTTLFSKR